MTQENVQIEDVSKEGTPLPESIETQPQPSMEERVAKLVQEQVELATRKLQSASDKAISKIQREAETKTRLAEDTLASIESSFTDMGVDPSQTELAKLRARDKYYSQLDTRQKQESAAQQTVNDFEANIRQHITDLGIDPDDKKIEWGDSANLNLTERQGKILTSVSKIQKENAKLVEDKAEQRFKELERKLRKDLSLDSVDTTTSAGVATDSDTAFIEGIGDGSISLKNKENVERAKRLGLM